MPSCGGKDGLQVADDARRVGDDVVGEDDAVDGAGADAVAQQIDHDGPVEAEQAAHRIEREAEAELNRGKVGGDDEQERETVGAVGHLGGDEPDRLDGDDLGDRQLGHTGVFALVGIEEQIPAADDDPGVDAEPGTLGRLEPDADVDGTGIAAVIVFEREIDLEPDLLDDRLQRAERGRQIDGETNWKLLPLDPDRDGDGADVDRPQAEVHRQLDFERARPGEVEAVIARVAESEIEVGLDVHAREQLADEAVGVVAGDDQLAAADGAADGERAARGATVPVEATADIDLELLRL